MICTQFWPRDLPRTLVVPAATIPDNLAISAQRYGDHPAIHYFDADVTYRQMRQEVLAVAGWLHDCAGVRHGDRVLLYLQNSPQWLIAYYAILRLGAIVVPVNPMNRADELRHFLDDSGARVAITAHDAVAELAQGAAGTALTTVVSADYGTYLPTATKYRVPDWIRSVAPALAPGSTVAWPTLLRHAAVPESVPGPSPDDAAAIVYTSGSTGLPKGCVLSHRAFMHNIIGQALWHWTAPATRILASSPMFHVAGLNHGVHMPIYVGGTAVVLPRWDADLACQLIQNQAVGHASIPPTALIGLLEAVEREHYDLSSLRRLTAGGAAMPPALGQRLFKKTGIRFIEAYGLTETAATTHLNPIARVKEHSVGIPFFGTECLVIDPTSDAVLPAGEAGELAVRGPQLFTCYWNNPEATRTAFVQIDGERYFRTGDIGYHDEEGYFFLTDRAKRMINASGYKVYPAEVERVLNEHPSVQEVCVVGTKDAYRGETVKAFVILHGGADIDEAALIGWTRARLAAYKCPRTIAFVETLPKSNIGKILWKTLQDLENQASA